MRKLILLFLFPILFFSCGNNTKSPKTNNEAEQSSTQEMKRSEEPDLIKTGNKLTLHNHQKEEMIFLFKEINLIKLSEDSYNLVLKIQFKNEMSYKFLISDSGWKLTDENMIEIEESGVYDFDFKDFKPATFFFTIVDAGFGKVEEVGYMVTRGTYNLHVGGMNVGKIVVQE